MSNKRILVVEDDADVRLGYHVLLKAHHYDTAFAADGMSAMAEIRKQEPDLIVLDLGLPVGDGFVVMDRLRANTHLAVIPVIVVSARDVRANEARALAAGAKAFLQKPWKDEDLLAKISHLLVEPEPAVQHTGEGESKVRYSLENDGVDSGTRTPAGPDPID
jgi:DNA-binding response OmpR family regulator